jgi:hypothetical protein
VANEYASLAELKDWLSPLTDNADDANLGVCLESASRQIDACTGRRFYAATETRIYTPLTADLVFVDDLLSITTLKTDENEDGVYETTWLSSDYLLTPPNAPQTLRPYSRIRTTRGGSFRFPFSAGSVQITGSFGYCASGQHPLPVKQATLIQAARLFKRKDSPFGVAGGGELGEMRIIPGGQYLGIDKDAEALLIPYVGLGGI